MKLWIRRIIGRIARKFYPLYSWCFRCYRPWPIAKRHYTPYGSEGKSCFPLCEDCWEELTISERLPYYRFLWKSWLEFADNPEDKEYWDGLWKTIEDSVRKGL